MGTIVPQRTAALPVVAAFLLLLFVASLVFRAPEGPAAREARRPHFVRRRASKPARALRPLRRPPHQWCLVAGVWPGASSRSPARPCRRPPAPRPGPAGSATASNRACMCACYGPAAALRHRGQAPQATRWPSCLCCLRRRWCCGRRRARPPARLGDLTAFGAAPRSPPVPSGPSGALHTGGTCGSGVSVLAMALPPHSAWGDAESVGASG